MSLPEEELHCVVCLALPTAAVEVSCCNQVFCDGCVRPLESCPHCRAAPLRSRPSVVVRRLVDRFRVKCDYCGAVMMRGLLGGHQTTCPRRPRQCGAPGCAFECRDEQLGVDHLVSEHGLDLWRDFERFTLAAVEGIAAACDVCPGLRNELVAARVEIEVERAQIAELRAVLADTESDRDRLIINPSIDWQFEADNPSVEISEDGLRATHIGRARNQGVFAGQFVARARQIQRFSVRVVAGVSGGRGVAVGAALNGTGLDALLGGDNRPVSLTNCSWMFETRGSVFYGGEYREGASRSVPEGHVVSVVVDAAKRELYFESGPDERSQQRIQLRTRISLSTDELARLRPAVLLPWNGDTVEIVGIQSGNGQPRTRQPPESRVDAPQAEANGPNTGANTISDAAAAAMERAAAFAVRTAVASTPSRSHTNPQPEMTHSLRTATETAIRSTDQPDARPPPHSAEASSPNVTTRMPENAGEVDETAAQPQEPGVRAAAEIGSDLTTSERAIDQPQTEAQATAESSSDERAQNAGTGAIAESISAAVSSESQAESSPQEQTQSQASNSAGETPSELPHSTSSPQQTQTLEAVSAVESSTPIYPASLPSSPPDASPSIIAVQQEAPVSPTSLSPINNTTAAARAVSPKAASSERMSSSAESRLARLALASGSTIAALKAAQSGGGGHTSADGPGTRSPPPPSNDAGAPPGNGSSFACGTTAGSASNAVVSRQTKHRKQVRASVPLSRSPVNAVTTIKASKSPAKSSTINRQNLN